MVTSETKPGATSEAWRVALVLGLLAATALAQHFVPAEKRWSRLESHQNVSRADAETESEGRGRDAKFPSDIPAKGWKDILLRTYTNIGEHRILALAAGVTYYSILAIFPAIAALVAIYGLFSDPAGIAKHLDEISSVAPGGAIEVAREQLTRVSSKGSETLGLTFVIGLAISLWSANAAMKSLFDTLNIIYGEREKRSFIKLNAISLAFTVAGIVFILAALGAVVIVPVVLNYFWLSNAADLFIRIARWPVMFADSDEAAPLIRFDRAPGFRDDLAPGPRLCWRIFVIPSRVVSSFPGLLSSQTVSDKVDAMRVMHEAVEDRVGVSWIANDLVPG